MNYVILRKDEEYQTIWRIVWGTNNNNIDKKTTWEDTEKRKEKNSKDVFEVSRHKDGCVSIQLPHDYIHRGEQVQRLKEVIEEVQKEEEKDRKANATALKKYCQELKQKGKITLTPDETIEVLKNAEYKDTTREHHDNCRQAEILYKGKWLELGRVDLARQVHSSYCLSPGVQAKDKYLALVLYGAEIKENSFYVIDSTTDG